MACLISILSIFVGLNPGLAENSSAFEVSDKQSEKAQESSSDFAVMVKEIGFVSKTQHLQTITLLWKNTLRVQGATNGHTLEVSGPAAGQMIPGNCRFYDDYARKLGALITYDSGSWNVPPVDTILLGSIHIPEGVEPCDTLRPVWEFDISLQYLGTWDTAQICIDTCFVPPGGKWMWDCGSWGGIKYPIFNNGDGPFCFQYGYACGAVCGDANCDRFTDISDAVIIKNHIFMGAPLDSNCKCDVNCDAFVDMSDVVWIINYIFVGGYNPCDVDGDGAADCLGGMGQKR